MSYIIILAGYLLGAIPFGLLIGKILKVDLRKAGSGNIGATNVLRTMGIVPGSAVLALDLLKGTGAVMIGRWFSGDPVIIVFCGLAAVIGHSFSVYLGFKGGKGAATGLGVLLGVAPDIFLFAVLIFLATVALTRHVSVGSMLTAVAVFAAFITLGRPQPYTAAAGLVAAIIFLRHRPNIKRLVAGTEPRLGEK
ncbi:acyl-phosphate glycerol 3-phosphate acyltransferase [candidate division WOR-1 bacterium RIFCSPHIGHO2_01_FULL_53_15]|uniref:Glycerol-3-phosphate acyltransferase n=1 Tax=candidate division WOR-1 bacterium RIFCSPHIGHO2_01_FULL_53_15 TaxID=1802564 RepID=A0A1F4PZ99_UNCSA|nr:MAG: acyl-phosphate glycerol 3-phosphate acyltransferase [candidate division WOR-1 bacterium RIFCSPHIGHO2_01_FULL_53_15]OGC10485.1 MAG: acyl-phosphate glycerol 3-phosphate acyltransferase [candidate division WOR-1 bacterium RIFCSPHIGHO2_02_FULL_53_26]